MVQCQALAAVGAHKSWGKESRLWERKGPLLVTDKGITK